jgi:hypothetical protein
LNEGVVNELTEIVEVAFKVLLQLISLMEIKVSVEAAERLIILTVPVPAAESVSV